MQRVRFPRDREAKTRRPPRALQDRREGLQFNPILKTKLGHVIIDRDQQRLDQIVAESYKGISEEMREEWRVIGQPEKVRRDIEAFRDAGVEYFITNFDTELESQSLKLFAGKVFQRF